MSLADGVIAAYEDKNVGENKTVNYTGIALSGSRAWNYSINNVATGKGTIEKANLTISTDDLMKEYDGTTAALGIAPKVISGKLYGTDAISGGIFAFADKNARTGKAITVSNVTIDDGNGGRNYNVTYQDGTGTITKADVTISVKDYTRAYDGTTDASGAILTTTKGQLFTGDTMSGGIKTFDTPEVGTGKTITVSDVMISDGNNGGNYNVTYAMNTNSAITPVVTPEPTPEPIPVPEPIPEPSPEPTDVILSFSIVTEEENIASAATKSATTEMKKILQYVASEPTQQFAWLSDRALALSNKGTHIPESVSVENIAHQLSSGQQELRQNKLDNTLMSAVEQTDRESRFGQKKLTGDNGAADGDNGAAEESDEKKKR